MSGREDARKRLELTDEQREAATAGDRDLWVTAGAGSGKTSVLAERYLHLHMKRSVPISKILAITFTDKAAAEMRAKIRERLREEKEEEERKKETEKVEQIEKSLRELPHAPISTIDSFC